MMNCSAKFVDVIFQKSHGFKSLKDYAVLLKISTHRNNEFGHS